MTASKRVVDSSGWLEYFAGSDRADLYADAIEDTDSLIVAAISLFEVFKRVCAQRGESLALQAVAHMQMATVATLDAPLAIEAARLSVTHRLPMADALIYATAKQHDATLLTQDADFKGLDGVTYFPKS